ncbi:type II toxin-antitoxin system RelE/ParE family toxin [Parvicella tangerina]|uniref:Type II toxin-antitoxin system RelE/ParE family toxin n=1 Tax=Parvicella tangerina TaxID=2829795 RepID=A0A916JJW2_9FLAO|nr:type II toxin-antitoxin system RelE/ParE family toxin [Parvicella tangerina]CAG5078011.1 hypothetical protein CRYO30217_00543 [Parvicella tangerina]
MATRKVVWSPRASKELKAILEFYILRNGNKRYSKKVLNSVEKLMTTIASNNHIGRPTSNDRTRVVTHDVFLIFYEISEDEINILSFWDNRQNPDNSITKVDP